MDDFEQGSPHEKRMMVGMEYLEDVGVPDFGAELQFGLANSPAPGMLHRVGGNNSVEPFGTPTTVSSKQQNEREDREENQPPDENLLVLMPTLMEKHPGAKGLDHLIDTEKGTLRPEALDTMGQVGAIMASKGATQAKNVGNRTTLNDNES